jgi:hypothetical protein
LGSGLLFRASEKYEEPWHFNDRNSVKWLVEHPNPLFLCKVDKKKLRLRIFHLLPRFEVWASGTLPERLELVPGEAASEFSWSDGWRFGLADPIVEASLDDIVDTDRMEKLREVFSAWVRLDQENCDRIRQGLFRFRRPSRYRVNEVPTVDGQIDCIQPDLTLLKRGLLRLPEALECIGGQVGKSKNYAFALKAALLLDHMQKEYSDVFAGENFWRSRAPGQLGEVVNGRLNGALEKASYLYAGLDAVEDAFSRNPLVQKFCKNDR